MAEAAPGSYSELLRIASERSQKAESPPFLVGIAGPPAAGKSTLARRLTGDLAAGRGLLANYCPMDGFHFPNTRLDKLGLREAKGRIDTFDAAALLAAMQNLTRNAAFWWPAYSRKRHEPVPRGFHISGREDVCVVEGNYLFFGGPNWGRIARLLDFRVFVDAPDDDLRKRLMARHRAGGRGRESAQAQIERVDLPNARLIRDSKTSAHMVIDNAPCPSNPGYKSLAGSKKSINLPDSHCGRNGR